MATTSDIKTGVVIKFNNELYQVLKYEHRTPGNKRAFYQVSLKNLRSGKIIDNRFRSGENIDIVRLETQKFQYLYTDTAGFVFMNTENYEQLTIPKDIIGERSKFIKEGESVEISFYEDTPVIVEFPPHIELKVVEAPPGVRGDTATGRTKPVIVETGATIDVPLFINNNDIIKVDTRTGEYIERINK